MPVYRLAKTCIFPHPDEANEEGLLAVGGDLSPQRLVMAYAQGIFPWYNQNEPILWWSPNPRMVLYPGEFKVSKSLKQVLRNGRFSVKTDSCFARVVDQCSGVNRPGQDGTWINKEMKEAYIQLHHLGLAHSFEVFKDGELIGGLYGVSLGAAFFGESMFHHVTDASKVAFYHLSQWAMENEFVLIDCQLPTPHLQSLGGIEISRSDFLDKLALAIEKPTRRGKWSFEKMPDDF
jgi:leucyl/phenylalanyl-tRNA---protein transferase